MSDLKPTVLAYAAGLFDGEGGISIAGGSKSSCGHTHFLHISVANTDHNTILWMQFHFGGYVGEYKARENHRRAWKWELHSQKAADFLGAILPYLVTKRIRAELAIAFQKRKRQGRSGKDWHRIPLTDEERAVQEAMSLTMRNLNKGEQ